MRVSPCLGVKEEQLIPDRIFSRGWFSEARGFQLLDNLLPKVDILLPGKNANIAQIYLPIDNPKIMCNFPLHKSPVVFPWGWVPRGISTAGLRKKTSKTV